MVIFQQGNFNDGSFKLEQVGEQVVATYGSAWDPDDPESQYFFNFHVSLADYRKAIEEFRKNGTATIGGDSRSTISFKKTDFGVDLKVDDGHATVIRSFRSIDELVC